MSNSEFLKNLTKNLFFTGKGGVGKTSLSCATARIRCRSHWKGAQCMIKEMTLTMDDFVAITKALSDPHRVRALMALREGELCVCQLIELFGLAPSTVSKHMSILKQARLVDSRKDSRWVYYRLAEDADNESELNSIINLSISLLEEDEQILVDTAKMAGITSEGLDTLCRRQRNIVE